MNNQMIRDAGKEFSPKVMFNYLKRAQDGTVYFDRSKLVTTKDSGAKFYYILNGYYVAGWKDVENLTPYFEVDGDEIIAGGYNIVTGEKTSRRRLISTNLSYPRTPYTYNEDEIKLAKLIIENT